MSSDESLGYRASSGIAGTAHSPSKTCQSLHAESSMTIYRGRWEDIGLTRGNVGFQGVGYMRVIFFLEVYIHGV